jgi:hypothetical protein
LRNIDGRTSIGRYIREFEQGLIDYAGAAPDFAALTLIDQAVGLELQIKLLERDGIKTEHDRRCYSAWLNAKRLTIGALKKSAATKAGPSLADILAQSAAVRAKEEDDAEPMREEAEPQETAHAPASVAGAAEAVA